VSGVSTNIQGFLASCESSHSSELGQYVTLDFPRLALWGLALCTPCLALPAWAHLGGDAATVEADRQMFHADLNSTAMQLYTRHDLRTESGVQLHEYQTPSGAVFAVSWHGPLPPDLSQLFGSYYQRFQAAAASTQVRPGMHRELSIAATDLVMHSVARTRAYQGFAYVPSLVPAGVAIRDLQ